MLTEQQTLSQEVCVTTKYPQKQQQSESLRNKTFMQPPKTGSANAPSLLHSENLGPQKESVARKPVQELASSEDRKEEDPAKLREK